MIDYRETEQTIKPMGPHMQEDAEYHWYIATAYVWVVDDSLALALAKVKEADDLSKRCIIWRVPGKSSETMYHIKNYAPVVTDGEAIGMEKLRD